MMQEKPQDQLIRLKFEHIKNARTYGRVPTRSGQYLVPSRLFRTARLNHATAADLAWLQEHDVRTIIDLRRVEEVKRDPDQAIPDAVTVNAPMTPDQVTAANPSRVALLTYLAQHQDAFAQMQAGYQAMVADSRQQQQLAKALTAMITAPGAVLWHCSMGKDRTGVVAALLLETLGVPRPDIERDYMVSNLEQQAHVTRLFAACRRDGATPEMVVNVGQLAQTNLAYLNTVFEWVTANYGDVATYLAEGLGIGQEGVADLRARYLQD